jgi:thymidylate kinase
MSSLVPAPAADPSTAPLPAPTALATFGRLDAEGIRYCIWKGSVRLEANLHGQGDLDVLVHPDDLSAFRRLLAEHGWRQPTPTGPRRPHSGDHFLLDDATGRIVHLDLLLGPYPGDTDRVAVPPGWQDLLLEGRRPGPEGVSISDPAVEAALLLVRLAADVRPWHRLHDPVGRRSLAERRVELDTLLAATSPQAVLEALSRASVPDLALTAAASALQQLTWSHLLRLRAGLHDGRPGERTSGRLRYQLEHAWSFQARVVGHLWRVYLHRPLCPRRGLPQGGLIVAVLGTDGSGKSTLVRQLIGTYEPKFDTVGLYLGSGDGRSSLLRLPLKLVRDLVRPPKRTPSVASSTTHRPPLLSAERAVWALVLAREKHVKLGHARRARDRGQLVLCDRYPQTEIPGELDGPLLAAWADAPWRALRLLAGVERRAYDLAARTAPDLVLSLDVDAATAAARRPGLDVAYLERRAAFLRSLHWGPPTRVEIIDATAAPEEVFRRASRAVWWTEPS